MNLQHLARWSSALALAASVAWAQEPTTTPAGPAQPPPEAAAAPAATEATPAAEAAPAPAPTRILRGRIVDTKSKDGLAGATISIKGTPASTAADENGAFLLTGVPEGRVTLHVEEQDHVRRDVPVAGDVATITVELNQSYVEELVVVGRATEVARKNLANAVSSVKADDLSRSPSATVDAALQGKVAGANIQGNSGAPGGGMQIKLRGISTINGQSSPLYVVDGVIISDVAISNSINAVTKSNAGSNPAPVQDDQVNRIADLNPSDIANIEILKGASAAAIYGSKASNGVVIITTKRAGSGSEPRVELAQRFGTYMLARTMGVRQYSSVDDAADAWGEIARDYYVQGQAYDHEAQLAGRRDLSHETYGSLSGSTGDTSYFASALVKSDKGIVINTGYDKQSARLNINHRFSDVLEVQVSSNFIHSLAARGMFNNDNNNVSHFMVLSSTPNFIDLQQRPDGSWPTNPFIGGVGTNPLQTATLMKNDEDVWRLIGSTDAQWRIYSNSDQELKLTGNLGVDRFHQVNTLLFPPELNFEPIDDGMPGTSILGNHNNLNFNWGANLVHVYRPQNVGWLSNATTSAGVAVEQRDLTSSVIITRNLIAGQPNIDNGTQVTVTENRERVTDRGFYLQEEALLLSERLQLSAAIRGEQSSLNGDANHVYYYPKAAASYRISGLPSRYFDEFKVRAAYGETGNLPLYGMRFQTLNPLNINGAAGTVVNTAAGNPNVRPERQREFEAGVDALMLGGTLVVELTGYQRRLSDLLLRANQAPSTGYLTQIVNGGELTNTGVEAMVQVTPFDQEGGFAWNSRTTWALNRSVITKLTVPAFTTGGFGARYGAFRIEEGFSATQIVGNNGIDPATGRPIVVPIGDVEPIFRMGFLNDFKYGQFSLSTNLDWQFGSQAINLTRSLYDAYGNSPDYEAGLTRSEHVEVDLFANTYVEDASFLKVREVTLAYELPKTMFQGFFKPVRHAKVLLSGRNLYTFTKYTGLDPEVSNFGNQAIARNIDLAPYPPSRSFWGSIELGF